MNDRAALNTAQFNEAPIEPRPHMLARDPMWHPERAIPHDRDPSTRDLDDAIGIVAQRHGGRKGQTSEGLLVKFRVDFQGVGIVESSVWTFQDLGGASHTAFVCRGALGGKFAAVQLTPK